MHNVLYNIPLINIYLNFDAQSNYTHTNPTFVVAAIVFRTAKRFHPQMRRVTTGARHACHR